MRVALIVVYTARLDECRDFYAALGLPLTRERHGQGPEHYAAEFVDGTVFELYPAAAQGESGPLRLGFTTAAAFDLEPGRHLLKDPDGRKIEVVVTG
jgi:catechol 2,3-dioxygenase-like lactoylglutathione lyase family enzyme